MGSDRTSAGLTLISTNRAAMPWFVASKTLHQPTRNRNGARRKLAPKVKPRKDHEGRDLLTFGTGVMDVPLIEHGLVGESHFLGLPRRGQLG